MQGSSDHQSSHHCSLAIFIFICCCWGDKSCPILCDPARLLSLGFSRQEYWSGLQFPSPGGLPVTRIKPMSPALAGGFFTAEPPVSGLTGPPVTSLIYTAIFISVKQVMSLRYNWFVTLHAFQVYNIMIQYVYILQNELITFEIRNL